MKLTRILVATSNKGKYNEIADIILGVLPGIEILSLSDLPKIPPPVENGKTFFDNALIKAKYYYSAYNIPLISEDSGLEVNALNGEPGVMSAIYAGENSTQEDLIRKLLKNMENKTDRSAKFVCLAVFMYGKDRYLFSEGIVRGKIAYEPRGQYGFGYDPVFIPEGYDKTFAELGSSVKNRISHRREAILGLLLGMRDLGCFL
ncbi:MAG: RdgB/HAM1 family non-canonical purine NTP pyrophosphatase [Brevinematales bacterium]|nr:RdgB/HAM1 family non-canonical purine NTP pyrophosphatase [Brevinematales bacterium]